MSATTSPTTGNDPKRPVSLLSLDAGGPQGISQLLILKEVIEKLSKDETGDSRGIVKRPCDVFDMIGGVGTGGLIAILLVVLKMTVKDALDEFTNFVAGIFKDVVLDPRKQTEKLTQTIHGILERYGIAKDAKLIRKNEATPTCKLIVPVMYKNHVGSPCILRNYTPGHEPPVDLTIAEAMLATCSIPPIFAPTLISKDFATFEFVSADFGLSNPTREIITEAHRAFGDERTVSCLLSIGCGHPGINTVPTTSSGTTWITFVERVAMDSEKTAQDIGTLMSHLTLYHRFSVNRGLEKNQVREWKDLDVNTSHTITYLNDWDIVDLVNRCANTIKHGDGFTTLEQLKHLGGGKVLPPSLPPLAANYVERKLPMEFIEKALFEEDGKVKPGSKRIVVTGIGGCGKTQLIRSFIEKYSHLFTSTFFIDGSSADTIRRDIVRHVRSLGGGHSQKSLDESMAFLSQAINGERLLIIDNVDDTMLELAPFLPRWQNGVAIVTSRNHSRGQLSPAGHLQLDVMTPDESAELLLRSSGKPWPPEDTDRRLAVSVAGELGCHPIALVQAISYMYNTGCSPGSYITLLRSHRDRLLRDHPATSQVDMRYKTAFAAFDASYNILPPRAQKIWHLLSFFRWQGFPVELITLAASTGFSGVIYPYLAHGDEFELGTECLKEIFFNEDRWDPLELYSILATLRSHSLITTASVENATLLQMHPLVHEWGHLRVSEEGIRHFEAAAVRLLCCGARKDNYSMMQYLYSHAESLSFLWEGLHANDAASLAFILAQSGMYEKSATLQCIAHGMVERELGPEHQNTIRASANLAVSYHGFGRYAEAEELQKEVLRRRKQMLGADHPGTIWALDCLAVTYHVLGRYAKALEMQREVLRRRRQLLGVDHPDTIRASDSLAVIHHTLGRYVEAVELNAEVLRQLTQLLGLDHPDTIRASVRLAVTYHYLGHYAEAEEMHAEALKKRTTLLGERHPDTIKSMLYLAKTYGATQRQSEASSFAQRALQLALETLGDGHPLYQRISCFLASLHDKKPTRIRRRDRFAAYMRKIFPL